MANWLQGTHDPNAIRIGPDTLLFGGTLPVIGGIRPSTEVRFALHDPVRGETIRHAYRVRVLPG